MNEFLDAYFANWKKSDAKKVLHGMQRYWLAYNSMLANWICADFLPNYKVKGKMHFNEIQFMKKAVRAVERIDMLLKKRE